MKTNRILARIRAVGNYRDAFLVLVSTVYVIGFAVWCYVAWRTGLGPMPVLDAQYFVAGVPPFLIVVTVVAVIKLARMYLVERWPKYVSQLPSWRKFVLFAVLAAIFVVGILIMQAPERPAASLDMQRRAVESFAMAGLVIAYLLTPGDLIKKWLDDYVNAHIGKPARLTSYLLRRLHIVLSNIEGNREVFSLTMPVIAGAIALFLYVTSYYAAIPQALGGAKPRCAALDIKSKDVSPATLAKLRIVASDKEIVLQTAKVDLYFVGTDAVVIGFVSAEGHRQIMELPRDVVGAIHWCDPGA